MDTPVGRALLRLTGVSLVAVGLVGLLAPRAVNVAHRPQVVVPATLGLLALAGLVRAPRWAKNRWLPVATAIGGGVVAGAVGLMTGYRYGWDARVVMDMAKALQAGRPLGRADYDYLSLFPNNLPLLAIDRMGVAVGQAFSLSPDAILVPLNAFCVGVTLYAVHLVVVRVAGRGPALAAQLATLVLVGTSPWLAVPYTDFYAMPFVVGGVAMAVKALAPGPRVARVALWVLSVVSIAVAYTIKTTPVVVAIAGVLTAVVAIFDHDLQPARRAGVIAACAVSMVAFVGVGLGLSAAAATASGVDSSRIDATATPPILWWVALGADEQRSPSGVVNYGAYSREMVDAVTGRDPGQTRAYAAGFLGDRWAERGLGGTLAFYGSKAAWNWGDGLFWAWGEGPDSLPGTLAPATGLTGVVHDLNGFHGSVYPLRADLTQALWLAVLLVAGLGLLRAPYRRETLLLAVSVLGIAAFTLVLQGRSRYLFAFVPVVVALAAAVHSSLPLPGRRTRA
ncbi:glycosyltransferase family protein [Terrabacter terrigena]|uniref:Glycosyltransferase RgtA/B/C/D-like domain-containing protein n=1 Tax=Terrabacter terrigena TaxID=574718 RepID=A0ABW3MTE0_9MICO